MFSFFMERSRDEVTQLKTWRSDHNVDEYDHCVFRTCNDRNMTRHIPLTCGNEIRVTD